MFAFREPAGDLAAQPPALSNRESSRPKRPLLALCFLLGVATAAWWLTGRNHGPDRAAPGSAFNSKSAAAEAKESYDVGRYLLFDLRPQDLKRAGPVWKRQPESIRALGSLCRLGAKLPAFRSLWTGNPGNSVGEITRDEAQNEARTADDLNRLSHFVVYALALADYCARDYRAAIIAAHWALELDPESEAVQWLVIECYLATGRFDEAWFFVEKSRGG